MGSVEKTHSELSPMDGRSWMDGMVTEADTSDSKSRNKFRVEPGRDNERPAGHGSVHPAIGGPEPAGGGPGPAGGGSKHPAIGHLEPAIGATVPQNERLCLYICIHMRY